MLKLTDTQTMVHCWQSTGLSVGPEFIGQAGKKNTL